MSNSTTRSDASGINDMEDNNIINKEKSTSPEYHMEGIQMENKSTAFVNDGQTTSVNRTTRNISGHINDCANIKSEFNIMGGSIGQASIGSQGPVTFNQTQKTFKEGAQNTNFQISGGNFNQSSLGGTATYNNQNSKVSAGGGGGVDSFFTPEQLTLHILGKGITKDQFLCLLEKQYSLVNLAFALPQKDELRDSMIKALLANN